MSSHFVKGARRVPQQQRGRERVAELLGAAAEVVAEMGYEAATMSEIAARANASIGSLYQFFPSKECIAACLREQYCDQLRDLWADPGDLSSKSIEEIVSWLVAEMIAFLDERPGFSELLDRPGAKRDQSLHESLVEQITRILRGTSKHLSKSKAHFVASVLLQLLKGMKELYAEVKRGERKALVREYERLMTGYLTARLRPEEEFRNKERNAGRKLEHQ